ncbi:MAG: GreA/GreB family elongation factor [Oceanospirillales bacterium]|uniref:Regulator of nucleoside diphosphate kinase n=1 Tax=Marinobacterium halophilum TaxID=267374 RepID=A0A2P8ERK5_9GAMM|nr:GreA/GreB family elongation factor [Marinobacterium halophilum]MBR9829553.1 GreA/GreB family elongation factor [Oceanospirillales bacterium]PSL12101.1 regulator of nucleoside diphosphate kinase [Marinobacterium halophilum]
MNCQVPTSLRRIAERLSHYFMVGEHYNYSSPLHLLSIFSRMEQLNQAPGLRARPGALLLLRILQTEETCFFTLTSPAEAKPEQQRISVLSPLGAALLGMSQGDTCRVYFMGENLNFKLIKIIH